MIDATINKSLRLVGAVIFNSCASYYHNHYQNLAKKKKKITIRMLKKRNRRIV